MRIILGRTIVCCVLL